MQILSLHQNDKEERAFLLATRHSMHTYTTVRLHNTLVEQAHHIHNRTLLYITPYTLYVHKNMHSTCILIQTTHTNKQQKRR